MEFRSKLEKQKLNAAQSLHNEITKSVKDALTEQETRHTNQITEKKEDY